VKHNETGLVVDGTNNKEIASAAIKLLLDPEFAQKLGTNGRKRILDKWRWENWSQDFENLLQ
jgi:phosphatidylinositol alpha-1,6-mannosyltransferase